MLINFFLEVRWAPSPPFDYESLQFKRYQGTFPVEIPDRDTGAVYLLTAHSFSTKPLCDPLKSRIGNIERESAECRLLPPTMHSSVSPIEKAAA